MKAEFDDEYEDKNYLGIELIERISRTLIDQEIKIYKLETKFRKLKKLMKKFEIKKPDQSIPYKCPICDGNTDNCKPCKGSGIVWGTYN